MTRPLLTLTFLLAANALFGQKNSSQFKSEILDGGYIDKTDIKNELTKYDIASLLTATPNQNVLGFIGDNYERIRIKLISVIKNAQQPDQYFVFGKSMVKDNVCDFQGTITITNAFALKQPDVPGITQGKVIGRYVFYENPSQKHVGKFQGVFSTNWYVDKDGNLRYDDLSSVADGFINNEFVGTWTSYSGTITKVCNWGDHRIRMSGDLDDGAGEFHPSDKYRSNGWESYDQAYSGGSDPIEMKEAQQIERREWWK